jgi:hypothetical protein
MEEVRNSLIIFDNETSHARQVDVSSTASVKELLSQLEGNGTDFILRPALSLSALSEQDILSSIGGSCFVLERASLWYACHCGLKLNVQVALLAGFEVEISYFSCWGFASVGELLITICGAKSLDVSNYRLFFGSREIRNDVAFENITSSHRSGVLRLICRDATIASVDEERIPACFLAPSTDSTMWMDEDVFLFFRGFHVYEEQFATPLDRDQFSRLSHLGERILSLELLRRLQAREELSVEALTEKLSGLHTNEKVSMRGESFGSPLHAIMQNYVNAFGTFKGNLVGSDGNKFQEYSGLKKWFKTLDCKENPFVSTTRDLRYVFKYAAGNFVVDASLGRCYPNYREAVDRFIPQNVVLGKVLVIAFCRKELEHVPFVSTHELLKANIIGIGHHKGFQDEVTFFSSIPGVHVVGEYWILAPSIPKVWTKTFGEEWNLTKIEYHGRQGSVGRIEKLKNALNGGNQAEIEKIEADLVAHFFDENIRIHQFLRAKAVDALKRAGYARILDDAEPLPPGKFVNPQSTPVMPRRYDRQLEEFLERAGLMRIEVTRWGYCFFEAVSGLYGHEIIRERVVEWLRRYGSENETIRQAIESSNLSLDQYCDQLARSTEWSGEIEMMALALCYGITLRVIRPHNGDVIETLYPVNPDPRRPTVRILYDGINHFDGVVQVHTRVPKRLFTESNIKSDDVKNGHEDMSDEVEVVSNGGDTIICRVPRTLTYRDLLRRVVTESGITDPSLVIVHGGSFLELSEPIWNEMRMMLNRVFVHTKKTIQQMGDAVHQREEAILVEGRSKTNDNNVQQAMATSTQTLQERRKSQLSEQLMGCSSCKNSGVALFRCVFSSDTEAIDNGCEQVFCNGEKPNCKLHVLACSYEYERGGYSHRRGDFACSSCISETRCSHCGGYICVGCNELDSDDDDCCTTSCNVCKVVICRSCVKRHQKAHKK